MKSVRPRCGDIIARHIIAKWGGHLSTPYCEADLKSLLRSDPVHSIKRTDCLACRRRWREVIAALRDVPKAR